MAKTDKPIGYRELEELTKSILEGQNVNYFEWLHQKHQTVVVDFNLSKFDTISELAKVGEQK